MNRFIVDSDGERFEVELINTEKDLRKRIEALKALLNNDPYKSIFLSPKMFLSWWRQGEPHSELKVLFVKKGDEFLGCAPMILKPYKLGGLSFRSLTFCVPRSDFIIPGKRSRIVEAFVSYWKYIDKDWDIISLQNIPEYSRTLTDIRNAVDRLNKLRYRSSDNGIMESCLPTNDTWDNYLSSMSSHFRKNLKYQCRRVEQLGSVTFRSYKDPKDLNRSMTELFDLEKRSWKAQKGTMLAPEEKACFLDLAGDLSGEIKYDVSFLYLNNESMAGLFSLICDERLYTFLTYYDNNHASIYPGRLLFRELIKKAFKSPQVKEISFVGNSSFVKSWTSMERTYQHLKIYNSRPFSRVLSLLENQKVLNIRKIIKDKLFKVNGDSR